MTAPAIFNDRRGVSKTVLHLLACAIMLSIACNAPAKLTLGGLFSDHAVLQRDKPVPIWGTDNPGQQIVVSFQDQTARTSAASDGKWIVWMRALRASASPSKLEVRGSDVVVLDDLLVGDVWLASGQSNMGWTVAKLDDEEQKLAAIDLPLVRHVKILQTEAGAPADDVKTSGWQLAVPQNVGEFSGVGYFFARELHERLGVPVGIVNSSWGGTPIEAWMSDASRNETSFGPAITARWQRELDGCPPERIANYPRDIAAWEAAERQARATRTANPLSWVPPPPGPQSPSRPGGLYNGMIAPLQPFALRGFLWYQGEGNAGRPKEYEVLFPSMIEAWRKDWGGLALPFYFVQLPNFAADGEPAGRKWAWLREAQTKALKLPATGMAVGIDLGDVNDIHPTRKRELSRRLALIALVQEHSLNEQSSGPVFEKCRADVETMRIWFRHAEGGLKLNSTVIPSLELAGVDRRFFPAQGVIDGETLVVSSPEVTSPVAVRYAWTNAPVATLHNLAGLPAGPFRSDDW
jgi:sialate O-acetylesterase